LIAGIFLRHQARSGQLIVFSGRAWRIGGRRAEKSLAVGDSNNCLCRHFFLRLRFPVVWQRALRGYLGGGLRHSIFSWRRALASRTHPQLRLIDDVTPN